MSISLAPQQDKAVLEFRDWFKNLPKKKSISSEDYDNFEDMMIASREAATAPDFLLEGYAGTGKSTILPFLIESAGLKPEEVLFVAPTGKASKVMTKKLKAQGMYKTATTIHRAIYRPKMLQAVVLERQLAELRQKQADAKQVNDTAKLIDLDRSIRQLVKDLNRAYDSDSPSFQLNVDAVDIKTAKLVVCDECSMVGSMIADDLRSFGTPILAIGDPGQLQPVGDTPGFCNRDANMRLTEVHRQAADNPIIWASMLVRDGKSLPAGSHGDGLLRIVDRRHDDVTFDLDRDAQVIVGTNNKRWQITRKTRELCGLAGEGPVDGEMMIVIKNSRRFPSLVNGTMVRMTKDVGMLKSGETTFDANVVDEDGNNYPLTCVQAILEENYLGKGQSTTSKAAVFRAKQEERNHQIDWAYAITCHKSQGSQWDECVVHDESGCFRTEAASWLYTAITRAAERLTIVQ